MNTKTRLTPSQQLLEFKRRQIQDTWNLNRRPFGHILPHTLQEFIDYNRLKERFDDNDSADNVDITIDNDTTADDVAVMDDNTDSYSLKSFFSTY